MNEPKAYIDGLLASGAAMIPREAVERVQEMVDKLPKATVSSVLNSGKFSGAGSFPNGTGGTVSHAPPIIYNYSGAAMSGGVVDCDKADDSAGGE